MKVVCMYPRHAEWFAANTRGAAPKVELDALAKSLRTELWRTWVHLKSQPPVSRDGQPTWDEHSQVWRDTDGTSLIHVVMYDDTGRFGDGMSEHALVNPRTNTYYCLEHGGFAGVHIMRGPHALPDGVAFPSQEYSDELVARLSDIASGGIRDATGQEKGHTHPRHTQPLVLS
jgi:hypothetical protein